MEEEEKKEDDVEDLLGRESVELDNSELENLITNNVVMITGAGGSIGSELSRQVLKFKPRLLICFDLSEYALYQLEQSFIPDQIQVNILYIVGDVKNELRLRNLISRYQPSLVFHAAAYKHVPMMENDNVTEATTMEMDNDNNNTTTTITMTMDNNNNDNHNKKMIITITKQTRLGEFGLPQTGLCHQEN